MMESAGNWSLIESDPGIFTMLIKKFGASGVQVEEIWTLEDFQLENLRPVHGLIFLFKYNPDEVPSGSVVTDNKVLENIFFAKQVINNACATQAVISLLLNCKHKDVQLGPELTNLKEFTKSFDPGLRGLTLSNSETIREAHNSMASENLFEVDYSLAASDKDAYHFVGYIPIQGRIYELDGLREGPIDHGPVSPEQDWVSVLRPILMKRMALYNKGEIHFNLMALVTDRRLAYERQLNNVISSGQMHRSRSRNIEHEINRLQYFIDQEDAKINKYAEEMARRRHNYLPFIMCLLQILAESKQLSPMLNKNKDRSRSDVKRLKT